MSDNSAIEWTDSTWNPVTGCSKVSEGCRNCYAEALSLRFGRSKKPWAAQFAAENVVLHRERLEQPLKWREPRRIFVNSMSDLFHELVPDEFIVDVFAVMKRAPQHTFQILTKRPRRMVAWQQRHAIPTPPHVWLGVSVEDQRAAEDRIPWLLRSTAPVRFLSCEPLLGPVDLERVLIANGRRLDTLRGWHYTDAVHCQPEVGHRRVDWVIVGGESGPKHRPMDLDWARGIRDACRAAGVPFFFKQVGGRTPKAGGRLLDGRIWDQLPDPAAVAEAVLAH